jgi:hypothetical protein
MAVAVPGTGALAVIDHGCARTPAAVAKTRTANNATRAAARSAAPSVVPEQLAGTDTRIVCMFIASTTLR